MPEIRQRWRLVVRRRPPDRQTQRDAVTTWEAALAGSGLPVAMSEAVPPRPRLSFAAPLPVDMAGEAELLDLLLFERLPIAEVREALVAVMPPGESLVDLYDMWLGAPPLAGQVVAADYRLDVEPFDADALDVGARRLLEARRIERTHRRGDRLYDLRPLIASIEVRRDPDGLWMRLRQDPERGSGRPEEVVGTLSDDLGAALAIVAATRERLWLAGEAPGRPA